MQEHEDLQERTTLRYEERITELHSIIAELNKKIDLLQGTTIRWVNTHLRHLHCPDNAQLAPTF